MGVDVLSKQHTGSQLPSPLPNDKAVTHNQNLDPKRKSPLQRLLLYRRQHPPRVYLALDYNRAQIEVQVVSGQGWLCAHPP